MALYTSHTTNRMAKLNASGEVCKKTLCTFNLYLKLLKIFIKVFYGVYLLFLHFL